MNVLTRALAEAGDKYFLEEKWLLCPSLRVGYQWIDTVTRAKKPVVNTRLKTLKGMALELAGTEDAGRRRGLRLVSETAGAVIMDRILPGLDHGLRDAALRSPGPKGYLSRLRPGLNLSRMLFRSVTALRLAGLDAAKIRSGRFRVPGKGDELAAILESYLQALEDEGLVDYAGVLTLAVEGLRKDRGPRPGEVVLLLPEDLELTPLEASLLDAFPAREKLRLPVDEPQDSGRNTPATQTASGSKTPGLETDGRRNTPAPEGDIDLLRWIRNPRAAPPPKGDGTAHIFHAVGEVNEVREVLRRCMAEEIPLEEVELLHTNSAVYVPLIHETMALMGRDDSGGPSVTFAEGLPLRYARPGRALSAWLSWIREDFPQQTLVRMVRDGLLQVEEKEHDHQEKGSQDFPFHGLAGKLRALGIGFGRDRYAAKLREKIDAVKGAPESEAFDREGDGSRGIHGAETKNQSLADYRLLHGFVKRLMEITPGRDDPPDLVVEGALAFVEKIARTANETDNLAGHRLSRCLKEMMELLQKWGSAPMGNTQKESASKGSASKQSVWDWLESLATDLTVLGSGPQPASLHVANIHSGGHSGRKHTFIIGLDDSRFPGTALQDPVLLDRERRDLAKRFDTRLSTAAEGMDERMEGFAGLLARLRGCVTLGFSCRNLEDDREMFPSPAVLSAFRILSGEREGDHSSLSAWLGTPASFAPSGEEACLDGTDWWLWRMNAAPGIKDPAKTVAACFGHLGRGWEAGAARRSDRFTEHDGWIGAADEDLDPASDRGPVLSSHGLETLGACPLRYYFRFVLGLEVPETLKVDTSEWLDRAAFGSLLHEAFHRFLSSLMKQRALPPVFDRHWKTLEKVLQDLVKKYCAGYPPPNASALKRQTDELEQVARIFLKEEEVHCVKSEPVFLEAAVALPPSVPATGLDTDRPVDVSLPGGRKIRIRGRIDRVDRILDRKGERFAIWDYKTGSSGRYQLSDPFREGRVIQQALYLAMVDALLKEKVSPGAAVSTVGYFFPGRKERGLRLYWPAALLEGWKDLVAVLSRIPGSGAFPATNCADDCGYCDFLPICGDIEAVTKGSDKKLDNVRNKILDPFRELRKHDEK